MAFRNYNRATSGNNYSLINVNAKANLALKELNLIKGQLNVEFKAVGIEIAPTIGTAGVINDLCIVTQGDSSAQRDGDQIKAKSIYTKIYGVKNASALTTFIRFIWFIDNEQDGVIPTVAEVLSSSPTVITHKNHLNRKRFTFLKDALINLGDRTTFDFKYYKKLNMELNYDATDGNTHRNNCIYLLMISTENTNTPTVFVKHRMKYLDN